jgi:diguanylate cyclase (GGDEF)-like protein
MQRLACHAVLVLDHAMLEQELEDLKPTDGLTGVANGRRLLEVLEYEIQRHRHSGRPLTVMLLDVEGLSGINRSYGRSYGNHILRKLAVLVEESVRPIDVVARCGLDEFAVVLPETDEEEALDLAERLQERVLTVEFAGGAVGLSIGIGHASPTESLTAEALMRRGEHALQEAKRQDRDRSALGVGSSRLRR